MRAALVRAMVDRFEQVLTPELRDGGRGPGSDGPPARDARVDRGEGNGASPRSGRSWRPSTRTGCRSGMGAAVRSDGHLRAAARGPVQRQPAARRSAVRLAVQHLPLSRPAAGPDRGARQRRRSRRPRARPTSTTCTSSAATTARTSSPARSTSTTATCSSFRCSTSETRGQDKRAPDQTNANSESANSRIRVTQSKSLIPNSKLQILPFAPLQLRPQHFEVAARRRS